MLSPDAAIENKLQTHFVNIEYRSNEFQFAFTTEVSLGQNNRTHSETSH